MRRQIPLSWLEAVLTRPEQRIEQSVAVEILQSRFTGADGKTYVLRAVVATDKNPPVLITVYRTSKIEKYWREE